MSIFIYIITALLVGTIPAVISYYLTNGRKIHEFKRLANTMNLNFALPKRKTFWEVAEPSIVGEYKGRFVNMVNKKSEGERMTELIMSCNTNDCTAVIEPKRDDGTHYIYQVHPRSIFKPVRINPTFDEYFFISIGKEEAIHLFTNEVCSFLLKHYNNIPYRIKIKGYEIIIDDSDMSSWERAEGGIAENTAYILNFLGELADLLERKRLS